MDIKNIKPFIPSKDYQKSKLFYEEIGFRCERASDDLTLVENGDSFMFLQRFYNKELADNFMLQICVTNIQQAYDLCTRSVHKTKISGVSVEPWGKVFYLWGPSGELLHITQLTGPHAK